MFKIMVMKMWPINLHLKNKRFFHFFVNLFNVLLCIHRNPIIDIFSSFYSVLSSNILLIVNIKMKKKTQRILLSQTLYLSFYDDVVAALLPERFPVVVFVVATGAAVVVKANRWPRSKADARRRAA